MCLPILCDARASRFSTIKAAQQRPALPNRPGENELFPKNNRATLRGLALFRNCSFMQVWHLASKPHPNPTSVILIDESDAGFLEGVLQLHHGGDMGGENALSALKALDGGKPDLGFLGELLLMPGQEGTGGAQMGGMQHDGNDCSLFVAS